MNRLENVLQVADPLRQAGRWYLFRKEFRQALDIHWTGQWYSEETMRKLQWQWVQVLLQTAYRSNVFYRDRLQEAGWPEVTRERFHAMRPLTKADIMGHASQIARQKIRGKFQRTSGGTGGAVVAIPLDRKTYGWYVAGTWRGLRWWGPEFTDRAVLLLGRTMQSPLHALSTRTKDWLMNWRRIPVDDHFEETASEILEQIGMCRPTFLYGYPSAVHLLARISKDRGWMPPKGLRLIVLTGEPVYGFQRQAIEEVFECPVAEEFGSGELGCMAFECPRGGLHVTSENVLLEVVPSQSPDTGRAGSILATQLHNKLFPLIRYETGDVGILCADPCPCGRGLPTLHVAGRIHERISCSQRSVLARPFMDQLFSKLPWPLQGRVRVAHEMPGTIVLQVEQGSGSHADLDCIATIGRELFSPGWNVRIVEVDRFRRVSSGKLPYFLGTTT